MTVWQAVLVVVAVVLYVVVELARVAYRSVCFRPVCHKCGGDVRPSTSRRPWYCIDEHGQTQAEWERERTLREVLYREFRGGQGVE